jgi:hypothetical protein
MKNGKAYIVKCTVGVIGVATSPSRAVQCAEEYLSTVLGSGYKGYVWVDAAAVDADGGGVLRADRPTALALLRAGNPLRLAAGRKSYVEIWPTVLL